MTRLSERARIATVEFRVLGPLSAFSEGEPRKLGGKRQQMVLAVLLSTPNEVVSQDTLIDSVWSGLPPESAVTTLHSYVSNLRKLLGGSIDRDGSGYIARLEGSVLDSVEFERMSIEARESIGGDPQRALEAASSALSLWHGRAFGDLASEPALLNEAMRLEEQRLTTLEMRLEADIALRHHGSVVQELEALTREHPFRERLSGFLMLSLYRSGRQADALRVYQRVRAVLGDELGIEPSVDLQRLEDQILTQDPTLDFLASAPTQVDRAARGYELREKIRDTRFGVLYRGFQGSVGREVSVLRLDEAISEDPKFVRRFETEMRAASELEHPHLIPIYDFWRDPEGAYLVTAFPHAGSLPDAIANEPWNISAVARLVDQLSSALSYVHRNGFIHGAFGVDSVLLDDESNAYISDLGLSGLRPGFVRADSPIDDVSAFAELALTLLSGDPSGSRSPLGESRPDLGELDPVFQRAWHPDPASRYQKPEDFRRALLQAVGRDVVPAVSEVPTGSRRNPYKGLRAFKESEAIDFHGRDSLIEDLTEAIASRRLVAVVGPSGSGKSSLVRAGLLPSLRSGAIAGSESWLIAEMFPGTHPFEELEAALVRVAAERPVGLIDELMGDDRGLARAAKKVIGNDSDELVVLIDQFEELFSLVSSETNRRLFLDSLTAAATDERSRLRFILTLRADFFDQPLQYPEFGEVLSVGLVAISPPFEEGLTRAIAQPARNVGVDLQPGLVTRIIDDVRDEPGGLPLMQYALTELFNSRVNNTMTLAAYERSGGVGGALANRADEIYGDLSSEAKSAARNLFLRLVNVDELADDTRRRVRQTELRGLNLDQGILEDVLQQFGAFRLLSFDRDAATRTPTVEVAHEALIREWDRLRTWIDDRREDLLIHRRMQVTARDWEDSEKDPSYLLRGSRLEQALLWQERTDIAITDDEMTFIEASIEQEKRDLAEHQALEEKVVRRRKALIGVLAGGLAVAGVLGAIALDRANAAEDAAAGARARELAVVAAATTEEDPERGILLALESIKLSQRHGLEPSVEALGALQAATQLNRVVGRFPDASYSVAIDPSGVFIATDDSDLESMDVNLYESSSPNHVHVFPGPDSLELGPDPPEIHMAFSPDGAYLAIGRWAKVDDKEVGGLEVWDLADFDAVTLIAPNDGYAVKLVFSANGEYLAALTNRGLLAWNKGFQLTPGFIGGAIDVGQAIDLDFVGNTSLIAVPLEAESRVALVDASSGIESGSLPTPDLNPLFSGVSPDGRQFVVGDFEQARVQLIDSETHDVIEIESTSYQTIDWHPDGMSFAITGNGGVVEVFDAQTGDQILSLGAHKSSVFTAEYSLDGEYLYTASLDQGAIKWSVTPDGPDSNGAVKVDDDLVRLIDVQTKGDQGFSVLADRSIVFELSTGQTISQFNLESGIPDRAVISASFNRVAGLHQSEQTHGVWDAASGQRVAEFDRCTIPKALSPLGDLVLLTVDLEPGLGCGSATSWVERVDTGEVVTQFPLINVNSADFSPSETFESYSFLALNKGLNFGSVSVYSMPGGTAIASFTSDDLESIMLDPRFSRDGHYLGLGMNSGLVVAVDMKMLVDGSDKLKALVINQIGHDGNAPRPAITLEGIMATTSFDQWVRLWDLSTRAKLVEFRTGPVPFAPFVAFTSNEDYLLYTDKGGLVRSYPMDFAELLARAEAVLTRTLTDDECTQYLHTDGCVD